MAASLEGLSARGLVSLERAEDILQRVIDQVSQPAATCMTQSMRHRSARGVQGRRYRGVGWVVSAAAAPQVNAQSMQIAGLVAVIETLVDRNTMARWAGDQPLPIPCPLGLIRSSHDCVVCPACVWP